MRGPNERCRPTPREGSCAAPARAGNNPASALEPQREIADRGWVVRNRSPAQCWSGASAPVDDDRQRASGPDFEPARRTRKTAHELGGIGEWWDWGRRRRHRQAGERAGQRVGREARQDARPVFEKALTVELAKAATPLALSRWNDDEKLTIPPVWWR